MPTTIVTGRDITFTIDGATYDAQATAATLTIESTINTYQTLDGKAFFTTDSQGTFDVEMLADWTAGGSLAASLWNAADSAPNTPLAVVFTAASGSVFNFDVQPIFPSAGGVARRTDYFAELYLRDNSNTIRNEIGSMKLQIHIETSDGKTATTTAQPPEFAKWEQKTGFTIQQAQEKIGISDLMFLAWNALKREAAGKPVKPYDVWCDMVVDITVGDTESPKVTAEEA